MDSAQSLPAPPPCVGPPPSMGTPPCEEMQAQLDFFQKLGYSRAQVQAVQQQLGSTDTDKLLGELVRTGAARGARQGPVTTMTVLVPPGGAQSGSGPPSLLPPGDQAPADREETGEESDALRAVVIDGSNVAMSHGNKEFFSCLGIQLAVSFFLDRGHRDVTVFVPSWRKEQPRPDVPITDQQILRDLEKKKVLVFTPSRRVAGRRVVCNDDAFIVKHAFESDGVIVSNDMYRDLQAEKPEWRRFIQERLLMFSFVNNKFMPPDDPLGRYGPNLDNFLRRFPKTGRKQPCPYGKKCTYGSKCRFHHPERVKQTHRGAPLDELRPGATRTASSSPAPGGPVSNGLALVEDMARKLSLAPDSGSGKHQDQAVQGKGGGHRTGRKAPRRDRPPPQRAGGPPPTQGDQLDSGLGSIDSQPEAAWGPSEMPYGGGAGQVCPPTNHCPHRPPPWGFQPPPFYSAPTAFPASTPAFAHHSDFQAPPPSWAGPFSAPPPMTRSLPPPGGPAPDRRALVRKKLLAIFSAQLVDAAMDRLPEQLDPQVLVAEILRIQGQNQTR